MKRRPTALDRDIAEYVMRLPPGSHSLIVEAPLPSGLRYLPIVRLKAEGMMLLELEGGKNICFYPEIKP